MKRFLFLLLTLFFMTQSVIVAQQYAADDNKQRGLFPFFDLSRNFRGEYSVGLIPERENLEASVSAFLEGHFLMTKSSTLDIGLGSINVRGTHIANFSVGMTWLNSYYLDRTNLHYGARLNAFPNAIFGWKNNQDNKAINSFEPHVGALFPVKVFGNHRFIDLKLSYHISEGVPMVAMVTLGMTF